MAHVFEGQRTFLHPVLRWLEVLTYKVTGIKEDVEQRWTHYTASLLSFSIFGFLLTYLLQRAQGVLPFNPQGFGAGNVTPDLAFNTATSFVTNTNWQSYSGESTLSYFVQMAALAVQNFASAAAGIAIAIALVRGFARQEKKTIGNFWVDVTRATVYVLLPLCDCRRSVPGLAGRGAEPESLHGSNNGRRRETDHRPGPGGLAGSDQATRHERRRILQCEFRASVRESDSADEPGFDVPDLSDSRRADLHVRQNGRRYAAGMGHLRRLLGHVPDRRLRLLWLRAGGQSDPGESRRADVRGAGQAGGNMEGKEVRFGIASSALYATVTTDASCGAVNSMHDSYTPIGGLVPLFNIMTGEVIFGGVGAGLYGILLYCILAVFIAGLMVGRTPEYLGKKIEKKEVKMAMLAVIATAFSVLVFTALSSVIDFPAKGYWNPPGAAIANLNNSGPHGFGEILYAYASGTGNNGSAFAGIQCQHTLVQPHDRPGDVDRPISVPDSAARSGRKSGGQEEDPGDCGNLPDARSAVCRTAGRNGVDRRRAHVLPGALARADRRALSDAERQALLAACQDRSTEMSTLTTAPDPKTQPFRATIRHRFCRKKLARSRPLFDPEIVRRALRPPS